MHISTEYVRVRRTLVDTSLQQLIFSEENCIQESSKLLDVLRKLVQEYLKEAKVIQQVAAQFGHMLNENSNTVVIYTSNYIQAIQFTMCNLFSSLVFQQIPRALPRQTDGGRAQNAHRSKGLSAHKLGPTHQDEGHTRAECTQSD